MHAREYDNARKRIDEVNADIEEIIDIRCYLAQNKLRCFKYNYALDFLV